LSTSYDLALTGLGRAPSDFAWLPGRILQLALFATILVSPLVFIEPSPYEVMLGLLAIACVIASVRVDRTLAPLIVLLLLWNIGLALSLIPVADDSKAVTFSAISFYLTISAVMFSLVVSENTEERIATIRTAYILAAFAASVLGIIGYFNIAFRDIFVHALRARATFKDPNVFGPFLILPLLLLIQLILYRGLRLRYIVASFTILVGLFLSFSRGAWGNFVASALLMLAFMFMTTPSGRFRSRILTYAIVAGLCIAALLAVMLSFSEVRELFTERAALVKDYDAGPEGRFGRHIAGLIALFDYPNGVGPLQFSRYFKEDPHNDYINAFFAAGWIGGIVYPTLVLVTLVVGFRAILVLTPWQPFLIAVYATYFGVICEGFIVGTDHWRHYYLLLGLVWGLAAATQNARRVAALGDGAIVPARSSG